MNKGKTDIFIENLPAGPDNINLAPDGSFWISLIQVTSMLCFSSVLLLCLLGFVIHG
jgi:sugar lactone lactonase YvrE